MGEAENPIRSLTGKTLTGAPLALSRAPAADIAPWFYWMSVASGSVADGYTAACGTLGDHTCIRLLFGGTWLVHMADGPRTISPGREGVTLYFGPQTRYLPISLEGSYQAITLHYAAGAIPRLGGPNQADMLDAIVDFDEMVGHGKLTSKIPLDEPYSVWFDVLEEEMRRFILRLGPKEPERMISAFERECLLGPNFSLADFAESQNVSTRTLTRSVLRDYGLTPKHVLRRARALDMAARLLGVALPREEAEMDLRFYDQSHRIREIRHFFGMTPTELEKGAHPILRVNMEARQNRRLRSLDELGSDEARSWRDPVAEPYSETSIGRTPTNQKGS